MGLPHTRGDEPRLRESRARRRQVCPTRVGMNRSGFLLLGLRYGVCPTRVGMNRGSRFAPGALHRLPHTRGDEPVRVTTLRLRPGSLPHTRGDEPPRAWTAELVLSRLPHTRGDEPNDG